MSSRLSGSGSQPLKGSESPRLWTRPLRELTRETSLGFEAVDFSEDILGRPLHPWQKWFLIHSLELAEDSFTSDDFPTLRFKTVILLVGRQNGKSYIMSTRLLWRMLMWDGPGVEPPLILGTAHKLGAASEILDLSWKALLRSDELRAHIARRSRTNGDEHLELSNGARYRIEAASDDGGRGLSVTDLGFDELRQQREWSAWAAMSNTTNAIHSSQVIGVSNAGEARSDVLRSIRAKGLAEIQACAEAGPDYVPDDPSLGLFEWSAPDDCGIWDRDGWAQANPSLGYPNGPTEQTLASAASLVGKSGEGMPEHKFRTEILCQWVGASVEGPFTDEQIEACTDGESEIDPASPLSVAFDVNVKRDMAYVAVAGFRSDGLPHVEVIAQRAYTRWVEDFLANGLSFSPDVVVAQGRGCPASSIIDDVERSGVDVVRCEGPALAPACGQFFDRVIQGDVRWVEQPVLRVALAEASTKMMGDAWSWNRDKSPVDIAPLCAVTFALWGLMNDVKKPKMVSAYATDQGRWWEF